MIGNCIACGSNRSRVLCSTCDGKADRNGEFGINAKAEITVSNTCMRVNDRPFVVAFPPVEGVTMQGAGKDRVIVWSNEQGVQHTPLSDVRGYWA
jgi:hypothetical protein